MDTKTRERAVPNYLKIQKAKEDYVQLHDFYASHEELLGDETAGRLFASLMDVGTPEQLRRWQEDIAGSSLSLHNGHPLTRGVKWENLLGHYDLHLREMTAEDKETLAFELPKIRENGFGHYFNRNMATLFSEAANARLKKGEVIAILYDQIDNHIAVGEDADRLFELFGWQTATATVGDKQMSVMPISDDILLTSGMFDFQLAETLVDMMDIRVDDPMEAELSIAQQTIDAFRRKFKGDLLFHAEGLRHSSIQQCIEHEHTYPFVEKKGDELSLIRSDARYETVVSGQSWNVCRERIPLVTSLAECLHMLMHDRLLQSEVIGERGRVWCDLQSRAVLDEYAEAKSRHGGQRLVMDHGAFFEAYGDDAVSLARQLHLPLWSRVSSCGPDVQMLMLSPDVADIATSIHDDVVEEKARSIDELKDMRLRPSCLNDFLQLDERYQDGSVLTKKDGGYAVRASCDGKTLPMKDIPKEEGDRYMNMPDGLARKICLNGILHDAYKEHDKKKQNDQSIMNRNIQTK